MFPSCVAGKEMVNIYIFYVGIDLIRKSVIEFFFCIKIFLSKNIKLFSTFSELFFNMSICNYFLIF